MANELPRKVLAKLPLADRKRILKHVRNMPHDRTLTDGENVAVRNLVAMMKASLAVEQAKDN